MNIGIPISYYVIHQIKKGTHKGKLAFYEPRGDVLGRLEAVNKLMPLIGSSGNGSDWLKKTDAVFKYFEEQGVKHCFNRIKITNKEKKEKKLSKYIYIFFQESQSQHINQILLRSYYVVSKKLLW